jgi:hypothetical protein
LYWCRITRDQSPLPPKAATEEEDEALLEDYPWVEGPIKTDYGYNVMYVVSFLLLIKKAPWTIHKVNPVLN